MINQPTLPAKAGYVEIIDENGNHVYAPTQETLDRERLEKDVADNKESANTQLTDLQMALCETYESNDKQLTDLQTALCEVYELVLGEGTV
nr:MAG TPA: hypothetical protein [Caudoviricetes sp.]